MKRYKAQPVLSALSNSICDAFLIGLSLLAAMPAPAGTCTWVGTGTNWNTVTNWSGSAVPTNGDAVIIPNTTVKPSMPSGTYPADGGSFASFLVQTGAVVTCLGDTNIVNEDSGGTVAIPHGVGVTISCQNATIHGSINGTGNGFKGYATSPYGGTGPGGSWNYPGASYGGAGSGFLKPPYGSLTRPSALGSSAMAGWGGNPAGGGAIKITASGTLLLNGAISVNGTSPNGGTGGSSGGSVWLQAGTFTGTGTIEAISLNNNDPNGYGGGGGRLAIEYGSWLYTGTNISVRGGRTARALYGVTGTVFLCQSPWLGTTSSNGVNGKRLDTLFSFGSNNVRIARSITHFDAYLEWSDYSTDGGGALVVINQATYTIGGLLPSTGYAVYLDGANQFGSSLITSTNGVLIFTNTLDMLHSFLVTPGVPPSVSNVSAVVAGSSVTLNGSLVSAGSDANVSVTVFWGTNDAGANTAGWAYTNLFPGWAAVGPLSTNVTLSLPATRYYYRFFASNSFGSAWGRPAGSFSSLGAPSVNNVAGATDVGPYSATLQGEVTGGNPAPNVWIYWGTVNQGTSKTLWEHTNSVGEVSTWTFSAAVSGLILGTTYYYICYASNSYGDAWSTVASFTCVPRTWTGAVSTNWNDPANWGGVVPGDGEAVLVPNTATKPTMVSGTYPASGAYSSFEVQPGAVITCLGETNAVNADSGGTVAIPHGVGVTINCQNATINGSIDGTGKGFKGWYNVSLGMGGGGPGGSYGYSGASYGGSGGMAVYGSLTRPSALGSSAFGAWGGQEAGAYGGGAVKIKASGTLLVNGAISFNGKANPGGGGSSGGSVWLQAGTFAGTGTVNAISLDNADPNGYGGGGGRLAIEYGSWLYTGTNISVRGGRTGRALYGVTGTVFLCQSPWLGTTSSNGVNGKRLDTQFSVSNNNVRIARSITRFETSFKWSDYSTDTSGSIVVSNNANYTISGLRPSRGYYVYRDGVSLFANGVLTSTNGMLTFTNNPLDMLRNFFVTPAERGTIMVVY